MPAVASKSKKTGRKAARDGRGSSSNSKASSTYSQETTDSTPPKDRGPNVIILSSAGKPIFVRHGSDEDEWSSAC
eukprot:scaffold32940_cov139-Skeletonema_marinoi.AAC.1